MPNGRYASPRAAGFSRTKGASCRPRTTMGVTIAGTKGAHTRIVAMGAPTKGCGGAARQSLTKGMGHSARTKGHRTKSGLRSWRLRRSPYATLPTEYVGGARCGYCVEAPAAPASRHAVELRSPTSCTSLEHLSRLYRCPPLDVFLRASLAVARR